MKVYVIVESGSLNAFSTLEMYDTLPDFEKDYDMKTNMWKERNVAKIKHEEGNLVVIIKPW